MDIYSLYYDKTQNICAGDATGECLTVVKIGCSLILVNSSGKCCGFFQHVYSKI